MARYGKRHMRVSTTLCFAFIIMKLWRKAIIPRVDQGHPHLVCIIALLSNGLVESGRQKYFRQAYFIVEKAS